MSDLNLPIACGLTDSEFRERRNNVLRKVGQSVLEAREIENGYTYRFPSDDDSLAEIANLVRLKENAVRFFSLGLLSNPAMVIFG